jgi:hypothetical protein
VTRLPLSFAAQLLLSPSALGLPLGHRGNTDSCPLPPAW